MEKKNNMKYLKFFEGFNGYEDGQILDLFLDVIDDYGMKVITNSELVTLTRAGDGSNPNTKYCNYFKNIYGDYTIKIKCGKHNIEKFKIELDKIIERIKKFNLYVYMQWAINPEYSDCVDIIVSEDENSNSFTD